jgi:hypothetical protein
MRHAPLPVTLLGCLGLALAACLPSGPNNTGAAGSGTPGNGGDGAGGTGQAGTTGVAGTGPAGTTGQAGTGPAGTTGQAGTGPAGTTGQAGMGGSASGTAGAAGTGPAGTTGMSGRGGGPAGNTGGGGSAMASCTFTPTAMTSTRIPTVGIVTFTTTLASPTTAFIDFGPTTSYGMTAPVDLAAASYRTLLLGMKANRMYNYRIRATNSSGTCMSGNYTLMTGALANGLMTVTRNPTTATGTFGGFFVSGQYATNAGGTGSPAYILDADGDYVWWYAVQGQNVTGARMSYDGKHMWINSANVPPGTASVHRVSMDGMTDENLSSQFTGQNHQLTILPDETVAFYAYGSGNCDDIKERAPNGTVKTIVSARTAAGITGACHCNTIQYSPMDDTLVFSELDNETIVKVRRNGQVVWVMNGPGDDFGGDGWLGGNHGIHILAVDRLLIFNNNSMSNGGTGDGTGSIAAEYTLNLSNMTATRSWFHKASSPRVQNDIMGDVQRLPNGNTLIGYSTRSTMQEVSASGQILQTWNFGTTFGYIEKRASLYGPPPK